MLGMLLSAQGKSRPLIGSDPPPKVSDWKVTCVAFGTASNMAGHEDTADGNCIVGVQLRRDGA